MEDTKRIFVDFPEYVKNYAGKEKWVYPVSASILVAATPSNSIQIGGFVHPFDVKLIGIYYKVRIINATNFQRYPSGVDCSIFANPANKISNFGIGQFLPITGNIVGQSSIFNLPSDVSYLDLKDFPSIIPAQVEFRNTLILYDPSFLGTDTASIFMNYIFEKL